MIYYFGRKSLNKLLLLLLLLISFILCNEGLAGSTGIESGTVSEFSIGKVSEAVPVINETLGSGVQNIYSRGIAGKRRVYVDFGGADVYTILPTLAGDVEIRDNQSSTINLPSGLTISSARFLSNGVQFTINGFMMTLLGKPELFSFVFAGNPIHSGSGVSRNFGQTAEVFGTTVPDSGSSVNNGSLSGTIQDGGGILHSGETDSTPPSVPKDLAVTANNSSEVEISWIHSIDNVGVKDYRIYRDGIFYLSSSGGSPPSQVLTGLSPSTTYCFSVSAVDEAGNESAVSNDSCVTTPGFDTISVAGVSLNMQELTLSVGTSEQLTASVTPVNATDPVVTWASSDPSVAVVSEAGLVTGVKDGSSEITVTTRNGQKKASSRVTVTCLSGPTLHNLLLIYPHTNYQGAQSFAGRMSDSLQNTVVNAFRNMPNLVKDGTSNLVNFTYDIVEIPRPVTSLTPIGSGYLYLSENDIRDDLQTYAPPGKYDSVHVIWYNGTIGSYFGLGGTFINDGTTTYSSIIAGEEWWWTGLGEMYGEIILHELLHGLTNFYRRYGYQMPLPDDLHGAENHGYPKTANEGWMPWYRAYMRGMVWEPQLNQYTGISPDAWRSGTPDHPPGM